MKGALFLSSLGVVSSELAIARLGEKQIPTTTSNLTCSDLTNVNVGGQDFTDVAQTVCQFWPNTVFGEFPVTTVAGLTDILNVVFDENGVWGELQELYSQKRDDYCLRREVHRTVLASSASET